MPGIVQRRTKLSGRWYDKGEAVPDELVTGRNVATGLVVRSAASDETLAAELESTRAELAEVKAQLAAVRDQAGAVAARIQGAGASATDASDDYGSPFDPSEHTVPEVLAHVDAEPDDLGRVLDVELGGKARKTLLDDLERRQDEADTTTNDTGGNAGGQ